MNNKYVITEAATGDLPLVSQLLLNNNLPVEDLAPGKQRFWIIRQDGRIVSVIGLEEYDEYGFLRSMATDPAYRNRGMAAALLNALLTHAESAGLKEVFLLTETAAGWFGKKGFQKFDRGQVPDQVKTSAEFTHLCPSSATVMKKKVEKKKILFVCVENSNRSQMSQAFANLLGGSAIEAYSAGSKPSGVVNPKAIAAMKELGYDLGTHASKSLEEVAPFAPFDAVVTMGCGDACPWMPAKKFIDWDIPDPRNMEPADFNKVRDLIREKVSDLLRTL